MLETFLSLPSREAKTSTIAASIADITQHASDQNYELRVAIALVPDPLDSQIGATFDQSINALERGASAVGWLRDRHWLPWEDDAAATAQQKIGQADQRSGTAHAAHEDPLHIREPGILLFRSDADGHRRCLALLLVGESHIYGISPEAFKVALRLTSLFHAERVKREPSFAARIDILGPTFSGTAESIRISLRSLCRETPAISLEPLHFLSGSATSSSVAGTLRDAINPNCGLSTVSFRSTVVPDALALAAATQYFKTQLGWYSSEIALLTESDSVYGLRNDDSSGWRLLLPVPSGIGDVRTALEKTRADLEAAPPSRAVRLLPLALALRLDNVGTPIDVVRSFAPLSAPINELNVNQLVATLARNRIRHVGLFLTDVRDKLFFAERLKAYAHSVSLFTFESSLLYTHARVYPFLRGMLVVASYPLASETQYFLRPAESSTGHVPEARLQFSSDAEEGLYNATVLLLGDGKLTSTGSPLADYVESAHDRRRGPAIWISTVGADKLIPVAAITQYDRLWQPAGASEATIATIAAAPANMAPPCQRLPSDVRGFAGRLASSTPFQYLSYVAGFLVILLYANCWAGFGPHGEEWRHRLRTNPVLRPLVRSTPSERHQWYALMTGFITLTTVLWVALGSIYLLPFIVRRRLGVAFTDQDSRWPSFQRWQEHIANVVITVLPVLTVLIVLAASIVVWRLARGLIDSGALPVVLEDANTRQAADEEPAELIPRRGSSLRLIAVLLTATVVSLCVWSAHSFLRAPHHEADAMLRFLFRFLRITGGPGNLSPFLGPFLICVGLLTIMAFQLRRLHIRDSWRPSTGFYGQFASADPVVGTASSLFREVDRIIREPVPSTLWLWIPLAVIAFPLLLITVMWLEPVSEPHSWGYVFAACFSLLLLAVVASFTRFLSLWYAVKRVLQRYNQSFMAELFKGFQNEVEWGPMRAFGDRRRQSYATLLNLGRRLRRICDRADSDLLELQLKPNGGMVGIRSLADRIDILLADALRAQAEGWAEKERSARVAAQRRFDIVSARFHNIIATTLRQAAVSQTSAAAGNLALPEDLARELREFVTLHAIGFIRYVFSQIQNSLWSATTGVFILLLGVAAYHFQPQRAVYVLIWSVVVIMAGWTIYVFADMERDTILSKIGDSTPGEVSVFKGGLFGRAVAYAGAPLITLVLTQFPDISQPLRGWLEPLLRLFQ